MSSSKNRTWFKFKLWIVSLFYLYFIKTETVEEKERQKKREDEMKLQNSAGDNEFSAGVHDDEHSSILQLFESSKRKREVEVQTEEVPSSPKKRKTRRETL